MQRIARKVKDGVIAPDDINESLIEQELETNCTQFPYPDLLIRTSGELSISNFLLWQLAYTELFFAKSLCPDFGEIEFFFNVDNDGMVEVVLNSYFLSPILWCCVKTGNQSRAVQDCGSIDSNNNLWSRSINLVGDSCCKCL